MNNIIVFTLDSNRFIAKKIAKKFDAELGKISIQHFADGEMLVKTISNVKHKDAIVIESTAKNAHEKLFQLLLLIDSIKRSGANSLKLYIPYFGYSRQERVSWVNEPVSCEVVARILDSANVDEILTFDLHHDDIKNFFTTKFTNIPTTKLFADYYLKLLNKKHVKLEDVVVVSPDHGSNTRADLLVNELKGSKKVILSKYRPKPNLAEHFKVDAKEVKGKTCIIIDDIVDTGGTIISATNLLLNSRAKAVYVAATHAVLSPNSENKLLESSLDDIVVTNTIERPLSKKIKVLDISELIEL